MANYHIWAYQDRIWGYLVSGEAEVFSRMEVVTVLHVRMHARVARGMIMLV